MTIGVYTFELHLPQARSLKNKRQVVKRLKDRLRARHNVAISEREEHADLHQRAGITVVSLASNEDTLVRLFEKIRSEAESLVPGDVIDRDIGYIDSFDADEQDWTGELP